MAPQDIAEGVLAGDRRAVARAISMVEDGSAELPELSSLIYSSTGRAYTVGLTGAPGAGKSSLTQQLIKAARSRDLTVGVIAIDPTSPFTGGALLGDRLRMQTHATDPGVFIRSMATRGHLGGLALAVPEAIRILDASGRDLVVVETVGVGQIEVDVAKSADTTLVVVNPGWGDSIQVAKAGILEIADVFIVNKADREGADRAVRDLETMIGLGSSDAWAPPVVVTSATKEEGTDAMWDAIHAHRAYLDEDDRLILKRGARLLSEVEDMVSQTLKGRAAAMLEEAPDLVSDLRELRTDPYAAAAAIVARVAGS
jgi:LAO/AO transport system kinase